MQTDFSTTIVCTDGLEREFHFARINTIAIYFHISVINNTGELVTGTLVRDEHDNWKLNEQELPQWFITAEPALSMQVDQMAGK